MAELDNPAPTGDDNPTGSGDQPPAQGSGDEKPKDNGGQSEAQRKLQSERDKARSENESLEERLDRLENERAMDIRDKAIGEFLKENKDTYKDVDAEDLEAATSPDELDVIAKRVQAKADKIRNQAQQDVQQVPEETMTEAEKAEAMKNLEKDHGTGRKSSFGDYLKLQRKKVK